MSDSIDWTTVPSASSLISIKTHSLHVAISGRPSKPLVVILAGAGDVTASWEPVTRLVPPHFRIFLCDRSGLGLSDVRPSFVLPDRLAVTAAEELHAVLEASGLSPPYVLCAHSYGAIIARELLHLWPGDVVGMVLVDGSTERQCQYFSVPNANMQTVLGDLNFARVTGLRDDAKMGKEEWRERAKLMSGGMQATMEEMNAYVGVCEALGTKKQLERTVLGDKPLSVIRAHSRIEYERIYEAGLKAGNGSTEVG